MKKIIAFMLITLLVTACGSVQPGTLPPTQLPPPTMPKIVSPLDVPAAVEQSPVATPTVSIVPTTGVTPMTAEQLPANIDIVNRAKTDLAQRLDISVDEIEVVSTTVDEFPGENFGCPDRFKTDDTSVGKQAQPESGVSPAFVTGTEIVLGVNGTQYIYRGKGTQVVFCFEK